MQELQQLTEAELEDEGKAAFDKAAVSQRSRGPRRILWKDLFLIIMITVAAGDKRHGSGFSSFLDPYFLE